MAFAIHPSPVGSHTTGRESLGDGLPTAKCCRQAYYWAGNPCGWADSSQVLCVTILLGGQSWEHGLSAPNMTLAVLTTTGRVTSREPARLTTGRARMTASTTKGTGRSRVAYHCYTK